MDDNETIVAVTTRLLARPRRSLPSDRLFAQRPAPARITPQAMARALGIDPISRDTGYRDGVAGNAWDPGELDDLSYAAGYVAGHKVRKSKGG